MRSSSSTITTNPGLPNASPKTLLLLFRLLTLLLLLVPWGSVDGQDMGERRKGEREGEERERERKRLLEKVLDGTEIGLKFFSADISDINLDGLFGLRVGQGQIIEALRECKSSGSCPARLQWRLQKLRDGIEAAATAAITYVEDRDPEYLQRFMATVNHPYILRYNPVTLTNLDTTPAGSDRSYDEEAGDSCYARLLGTFKEDGKLLKGCSVTEACWNKMTQGHRSRYSITHQLLYFILIEKQGCWKEVEKAGDFNVTETEARLCGSIYNEAVSEVKDGKVSEGDQDIFLEQVVLCGCLGFENFLRADWMRMVLRWQRAIGCFSSDDPDLLKEEYILSIIDRQKQKVMRDLQWEAHMIEEQNHGRKLLRETVMRDGCLSHKSGLGFGNLCLYTRFLVRQLYFHQ